jgi:transcription-repair coupling factor (superfamily II helicase)
VYKHPVRLELFGDEVESIRLFDGATQRTLRELGGVVVHPVRETIRTPGGDPRARLLEAADAAALPSSKTRHLLEQIEAGEDFFGIEALAPLFHAAMVPLFDHLAPGTRLVVEDPAGVLEEVRRSVSKLRESAAHRRAEHRLALDPGAFFLDEEAAEVALQAWPRLELRSVELTSSADAPADGARAGCGSTRRRTPPSGPSCSSGGRRTARGRTGAARISGRPCEPACSSSSARATGCASAPRTGPTRIG